MYFENTGRENTEKTVELAVNTAREEEYAILLLPLTPVIPQAY